MNEQRVEIEMHGKKFEVMIPYNEYIISQIDFKKDQVDHALVYAAIKLAVQNDSVLSKNTEQTKESENEIDEISDKIQIFLNQ